MRKVIRFFALLFSLAFIIVIVLGLIAPSEFRTERAININAPQEQVAKQMFYFSNLDKWGPWKRLDKDLKSQVIGTDGKEGAIYTWEGNGEVGSGELENKFISENEMQYVLNITTPWEQKGNGYMRVMKSGDGNTIAIWGLSIESTFPINGLLMVVGMTGKLDKFFDEGLHNLKTICEQPQSL